MEDLGFVCAEGANVADFLTGVTIPTEREIRPGYEHQYPQDASAILACYEKLPIHGLMTKEAKEYPSLPITRENTEAFQRSADADKHPGLPKNSSLTTNFRTQVQACVFRQYQITWGDKSTFIIKQVSTLVQALLAGSLFYNASNDSAGLFIKGGALFFYLLLNALLSVSEVVDSFAGHPVLLKHKAFAFSHPSAFCIAKIAADILVIIFQISIFSIVLYFMVGLTMSASAFSTYWIVLFAGTMVSS
jgi:hypothetical protein